MSAGGNDNSDNIIFTIKGTKLYVPVLTLSARDNQEVAKTSQERIWKIVYWNEYKTKSDNKNTTSEFRYFLESKFVEVNRLFVLVIQMKVTILKDLMLTNIVYQKV